MKFIIGIVSFIISAFSVILIETIFLSGVVINSNTNLDSSSTASIFGLVNFILIGGLTKIVYNWLLNLYNKKVTSQYKPIDLDEDSPFKYTRENKQENTTKNSSDIDENNEVNNKNKNSGGILKENSIPDTTLKKAEEENEPSILKIILNSAFYAIALIIVVSVIILLKHL